MCGNRIRRSNASSAGSSGGGVSRDLGNHSWPLLPVEWSTDPVSGLGECGRRPARGTGRGRGTGASRRRWCPRRSTARRAADRPATPTHRTHRRKPPPALVGIIDAHAGVEALEVPAHRVTSRSPKPAQPAGAWARVCSSPARQLGPGALWCWWIKIAARFPSANQPAVAACPKARILTCLGPVLHAELVATRQRRWGGRQDHQRVAAHRAWAPVAGQQPDFPTPHNPSTSALARGRGTQPRAAAAHGPLEGVHPAGRRQHLHPTVDPLCARERSAQRPRV